MLLAHFFAGDFGHFLFQNLQGFGIQVFGGDIDVQGAVLLVAVGSLANWKRPSLSIQPSFSSILVWNERLSTTILDGAMVPVGLINAPICRSVTKFSQLVELDVVAYAFFPFHGETAELEMAVAQRNIVGTVAGVAGDVQFIEAHAAFIGQLDVHARRLQLMAVAAPAAVVIGLAAEAFQSSLMPESSS